MNKTEEFLLWLAKQVERKDPIGDFARDYGCALGIRTLSGIDSHLKEIHHVHDNVLKARDLAWREFVGSEKLSLQDLLTRIMEFEREEAKAIFLLTLAKARRDGYKAALEEMGKPLEVLL